MTKSGAYVAFGMLVPEDIIDSLKRYIEHGIPTGGFLEAVIDNDLKEAVGRADENNIRILPAIVSYLYNECPMGCWGSPERREIWMDTHRVVRQQKEEAQ